MSVLENDTLKQGNFNSVKKIVDLIRLQNDYKNAAIVLQDSGLTLFQLSSMTLRLTIYDMAKLGDELVKI